MIENTHSSGGCIPDEALDSEPGFNMSTLFILDVTL